METLKDGVNNKSKETSRTRIITRKWNETLFEKLEKRKKNENKEKYEN